MNTVNDIMCAVGWVVSFIVVMALVGLGSMWASERLEELREHRRLLRENRKLKERLKELGGEIDV